MTGIESFNDIHDLDGNGQIEANPIDDFYTAVECNFNCNGATFTNVTFRPAKSFEVLQDAKNATYGNVRFDGLEAGETLTIGSGVHGAQERFYNVRCENVTGGEIRISDYAIVNNLDLSGAQAEVTIGGRAQVNDMNAEGAHFLKLAAEPGAQIVRGSFNGTTIDMASELQGSIWRNCEFKNANLHDVNFQGAQLTDTHFVNTDMSNVNLTGARLSNCSITGVDISTIDATGAHFHNVTINGQPINSPRDFMALQQANSIGRSMAGSFNAVRGMEDDRSMSMAELGRPLGMEAAQTSLTSQQGAGVAATPAAAIPAPSQGISV